MFDRDEQEITRIISEGLEAILSGASTMEEVIAAHPEQAAILRSELETANWLIAQQAQVSARPGFVAASRKRVVARIQEEASNNNAKNAFFGMIWPQRVAYRWVAALSLFFILLSGLGGVVTISQNSLPGDNLYQVKRAYEQVAISVTSNEAQRASLTAQFSRRRLDEARQLISKGDYAAAESSLVEFEQGVNQAVTLLQQVSDRQLNEKQNAAVSMQQNLSKNTDQLTQMAPIVPTEILSVVIHARNTSMNGVIAASRVIDEVKEKQSATPIPQPTSPIDNTPFFPPPLVQPVILPTSTAVPTVIYAPVKTATDVPPAPVNPTPVATTVATQAPTATVIPVEPTATIAPSETPTDIPTATITPVPPLPTATNTPLPTDTPQSTVTPLATPTNTASTPISNASSPTQTPTLQSISGTQPAVSFAGSSTTPDPRQASPTPTAMP